MAGHPRLQHGPLSYKVNLPVNAEQLVEADGATGLVKPATSGTKRWLGVALDSGRPVGTGTPTDFSTIQPGISVARNCESLMTYANDANFGDALIAAANGQVTPAGATPDAATIVGKCTEPGGATAGSRKRTWIN